MKGPAEADVKRKKSCTSDVCRMLGFARKERKKPQVPRSCAGSQRGTGGCSCCAGKGYKQAGQQQSRATHSRHPKQGKGQIHIDSAPRPPAPLPASTTRTRRDASKGPRLEAVSTNPRLTNDCSPLSDTHFRSRQTCPVVVFHSRSRHAPAEGDKCEKGQKTMKTKQADIRISIRAEGCVIELLLKTKKKQW